MKLCNYFSKQLPLANRGDKVQLIKSPTYTLCVENRQPVFLECIKGESNFRILSQNEYGQIKNRNGMWTWEYCLFEPTTTSFANQFDKRTFYVLEDQLRIAKYRNQRSMKCSSFMKSSSQTNKKIAEKKYNRSLLKRPSKRLKTLVWEKKFTLDVGRAKCPCCQENFITQFDFECAHIRAFSKGGKTILSNLSPCCRPCNASCGQKGLWDFKKSLQ